METLEQAKLIQAVNSGSLRCLALSDKCEANGLKVLADALRLAVEKLEDGLRRQIEALMPPPELPFDSRDYDGKRKAGPIKRKQP